MCDNVHTMPVNPASSTEVLLSQTSQPQLQLSPGIQRQAGIHLSQVSRTFLLVCGEGGSSPEKNPQSTDDGEHTQPLWSFTNTELPVSLSQIWSSQRSACLTVHREAWSTCLGRPARRKRKLHLRSVTTKTVSQASGKICVSRSLTQQAYKGICLKTIKSPYDDTIRRHISFIA